MRYSQLVAELNLLRPHRLARMVLPAVEFFKPERAFVEWMRRTWNGKMIYDVGAGTGLCSAVLRAVGMPIKPIDLFHREREHCRVEIADGTSFDYDDGSTIMLCRPSHGLFPVATIERATECGVRRVLYIGLARNVSSDLMHYRRRFKRLLSNIGQDGEHVYEAKIR